MMVVITMTNCPTKLRGDLSRWLIEIDTNVFVGNLNPRVREFVWERVCENIKNGRASMAFGTSGEQKLDFKIHNTNWEPVDFDGLKLIRRNWEESVDDKKYKNSSKAVLNHKSKLEQRKRIPKGYKYAVIDVETTGIKDDDNIIEIGAVIVQNGEVINSFSTLVKSQKSIPDEIVELTGITENLIENNGTSLKKAIETFIEFCGDLDLVGHNINFDMGFLQRACLQNGFSNIKNKIIDTLKLARNKVDDVPNYKLETIAKYFEIEQVDFHRAESDCIATYRIYEKLKEI